MSRKGSRFMPFCSSGHLDHSSESNAVSLILSDVTSIVGSDSASFWETVKQDASFLEFVSSYLRQASRPFDDSFQTLDASYLSLWNTMLSLLHRMFVSSSRDTHAPNRLQKATILANILNVPSLLDTCALYTALADSRLREIVLAAVELKPTLYPDFAASGVVIAENITHVVEACCTTAATPSKRVDEHTLNNLLDGLSYLRDTCLTLSSLIATLPESAPLLVNRGPTLIESLGHIHDRLIPAVQSAAAFERLNSNSNTSGNGGGGGGSSNSVSPVGSVLRHLEFVSERLTYMVLVQAYIERPSNDSKQPQAGSCRGGGGRIATEAGEALLNAIMMLGHREGEPNNSTTTTSTSTINTTSGGGIVIIDTSLSLGPALAQRHGLAGSIQQALMNGKLTLDEAQTDYLAALMDVASLEQAPAPLPSTHTRSTSDNNTTTHTNTKTTTAAPAATSSSSQPSSSTANTTTNDMELISLVSQITDLLPDYGEGFLATVLETHQRNVQQTINALLEGNLPKSLQKMDTQMSMQEYMATVVERKQDQQFPRLPQQQQLSSSNSFNPSSTTTTSIGHPTTGGPSSSTTTVSKADALTAKYLDTRQESYRKALLAAAAASQWEYEDEYDDSFDDLGVKIGADGVTEDEIEGNSTFSIGRGGHSGSGHSGSGHSGSGHSSGGSTVLMRGVQQGMQKLTINNGSGGGSSSTTQGQQQQSQQQQQRRKQPPGKQLYVFEGRIYNYPKAGATPVGSQESANAMIAEHHAAKQHIHGLGAGGNFPGATTTVLTQQTQRSSRGSADTTQQQGGADGGAPGSNSTAGNSSSSGGRGGGRGVGGSSEANDRDRRWKDKNKSAVGNHNRKDRAMQKMGRGMT